MKDRPVGVSDGDLVAALAAGWGLDVSTVEYRPVGFGSYHWEVETVSGTGPTSGTGPASAPGAVPQTVAVPQTGPGPDADRDAAAGTGPRKLFVTVDALRGEPLPALRRLGRAMDTAARLRDAGLEFVVAPVPDRDGATVRPLGDRHAVAVFPVVAGTAGEFGPHRREDVPEMLALLVRLHAAGAGTAAGAGPGTVGGSGARPGAPRADLVLPGRDDLEDALAGLGRTWTGGPFAEPARELLARRAAHVRDLLGTFDTLVDQVRDASASWVVTHGEPHPGNVIRGPGGLRLIDWDTVQLAPPERDLWMLDGDEELLAGYTRATGHRVSPTALALYRLWWDLADVAGYMAGLRGPHEATEDTTAAWTYLNRCLAG